MNALVLLLLLGSSTTPRCGHQRQAIKTLADSEASQVSNEAVDITIPALRALPAPKDLGQGPDYRRPVELQLYRVHALLLGYKHEADDDDYHLVVADPKDAAATIIAEIPAGHCMPSAYSAVVERERSWLVSNFGPASKMFRRLPIAVPIQIEGVGFFDFLHHQTGVSPNGVEIHPVLLLQRDTVYKSQDDQAQAESYRVPARGPVKSSQRSFSSLW